MQGVPMVTEGGNVYTTSQILAALKRRKIVLTQRQFVHRITQGRLPQPDVKAVSKHWLFSRTWLLNAVPKLKHLRKRKRNAKN